MTAKIAMTFVWLLPLVAAGFSMESFKDQRRATLGGRFGVYQYISSGTTRPTTVSTWICSGSIGVHVPAIDWRIDDPKMTGLRQLWSLSGYRTNALPQVWQPKNTPPTTPEVNAFLRFSMEKDGQSIPKFIERYGLPSRYLTGRWARGEVAAFNSHGFDLSTSDVPLQGQDFLIYDLPSGHAVALYVPKPPADQFITAIIVDSKGELLSPNMAELRLPHPTVHAPRKVRADSHGRVTAMGVNGHKEIIGTWTARKGNLVVNTIKKNTDAFASDEIIDHAGARYSPDILLNEQEIICVSMPAR